MHNTKDLKKADFQYHELWEGTNLPSFPCEYLWPMNCYPPAEPKDGSHTRWKSINSKNTGAL